MLLIPIHILLFKFNAYENYSIIVNTHCQNILVNTEKAII